MNHIVSMMPAVTSKQIYSKLKTNLKLIIQRLKLMERKKTEIALKGRKEIAGYLQDKKYDKCRIKVEHIIREDYEVEAYEILEMFCDLVVARFGLLEFSKELDPGLLEAVSSILWTVPRLRGDIKELDIVENMFCKIYSNDFVKECQSNSKEKVNRHLIHRVTAYVPSKKLVELYLVEIAKNFKVVYTADLPEEDMPPPPDLPPPPSVPPSSLQPPPPPSNDGNVPEPIKTDNSANLIMKNDNEIERNLVQPITPIIASTNYIKPPEVHLPSVPSENNKTKPSDESNYHLDDLMARFNRLKNN